VDLPLRPFPSLVRVSKQPHERLRMPLLWYPPSSYAAPGMNITHSSCSGRMEVSAF